MNKKSKQHLPTISPIHKKSSRAGLHNTNDAVARIAEAFI